MMHPLFMRAWVTRDVFIFSGYIILIEYHEKCRKEEISMKSGYIALALFVLTFTAPFGFAEETKDISLPPRPKTTGVDLMTALEKRQSTRMYSSQPITMGDLSAILWAANGVNREDGKRTAPSAYGDQYIHIYVVTDSGSYLYNPLEHVLKYRMSFNTKSMLSAQKHVLTASHVLVIVADQEKIPGYFIDKEIKMRWAHATAGAIAQNVYLMAAAKEIGTCIVGGINEQDIQKSLKLPKNFTPLYIMPLGYKR